MLKKVGIRGVASIGVIVCAAIAAGCGGSSGNGGSAAGAGAGPVPEPKKPVTITFASWVGQQKEMQQLYSKFHAQHPNITIKFSNIPSENANQKLTAEIAGGDPPDVAYLDASTVNDFSSRGALVNLDDYIKRSKIVDPNDYVDAFKTFNLYQNHLYGLPFDGESTGLFYRKDLFKAAGITQPPTTWDEFEADAQKLTVPAKKQYGTILFAPSPESAYYWYPWLWQAGGDLLDKDAKKVEFNSDAGRRSADFYIGLTKYAPKDYLNSNSYDGRVAFANGSVAMYVAGAWLAGVLDTEDPKISGKWATAPLPQGSAGCATTVAGDSLVMLANSQKQDAAWKWMEFLSAPANMAYWTFKAKNSTLLPPRKSLLQSPELGKDKPILKGFADQMKCGVANVIANPKWPKIEEAISQELGKAMYGDETPEQALAQASDQGQSILDRSH